MSTAPPSVDTPFVAFAGSTIDRADHVRANPSAIENLMTMHARLLSLDGLDPVLDADGNLGWTSLAEANADAELLFLGIEGERGHFAQVPDMIPKVTIMLIEHDDSLLLGRQPMFPPRNYSALAGFVEPGETLEEAVARETFEEAGVVAHGVTYVASQPWPFPSSLMIGCHGFAKSRDIVVDKTELDDARWFTRAEVADAIAASDRGEVGDAFGCPPRFAVANVLMRWWLERG